VVRIRPSLLSLACLVLGCSDGSTEAVCVAGSTQLCVGAGACTGGQACLDDGSGWGACVCAPPPDAGPPDAGPPDAGPPPTDMCVGAEDAVLIASLAGDAGTGPEAVATIVAACMREDCIAEVLAQEGAAACVDVCVDARRGR